MEGLKFFPNLYLIPISTRMACRYDEQTYDIGDNLRNSEHCSAVTRLAVQRKNWFRKWK